MTTTTTSDPTPSTSPFLSSEAAARAVEALVDAHGETVRTSAARGVRQCRQRWLERDGDEAAFHEFCLEHFAGTPDDHRRLVDRLETALEQIRGHLYEMRRNLRRWSDLVGDSLPATDALLATFDPAPDLVEQTYAQKIAFVALLNLERSTLDRMLELGGDWDTDRWAETRLVGSFGPRIPQEVADLGRELHFKSHHWVSNFHVPVGTLVDTDGRRWFEADRALLAHWLVREEIKAAYNDPDGIGKQRALAWVIGRYIDGSLPAAIMDRTSEEDWDPAANTIGGGDPGRTIDLERYEHW
ncbi:MAG: hypothetical protein VX672_00860, partial [Planctomycetota bacterium]|nr:hypothetical protein [Planctomycetota bacterium]